MAGQAVALPPAPAPERGVEMADVFRAHAGELAPLSEEKRRVARAIVQCRTAALGAHAWCCQSCSHLEASYNSCRNRHCPKCQYRKQQEWLEKRESELLDVNYFHVVFTIPHVLKPLFQTNPKKCYALLFAAVAETLKEVALRPKNLGAQIGFLAVLHTWTQKLEYHPHIHCVVPGGGLCPQSGEWIDSPKKYFLPVRILSMVFRAKLLEKLDRAIEGGKLLAQGLEVSRRLAAAARKRWVVYSKPPFAGPKQVLQYLARYTHRIAISNARILSLEQGEVRFRYRDRSDGNRHKTLTLAAAEFLRRFLQHVLPRGLVRLRYYGFLAQSQKATLLEHCRQALREKRQRDADKARGFEQKAHCTTDSPKRNAPWLCPKCGTGQMLLVARFDSEQVRWWIEGRSTMH